MSYTVTTEDWGDTSPYWYGPGEPGTHYVIEYDDGGSVDLEWRAAPWMGEWMSQNDDVARDFQALSTLSTRAIGDPPPRPHRAVPIRSLHHLARLTGIVWHLAGGLAPWVRRTKQLCWPDATGSTSTLVGDLRTMPLAETTHSDAGRSWTCWLPPEGVSPYSLPGTYTRVDHITKRGDAPFTVTDSMIHPGARYSGVVKYFLRLAIYRLGFSAPWSVWVRNAPTTTADMWLVMNSAQNMWHPRVRQSWMRSCMVDETIQGDHGDALALLALALYALYHLYAMTYTPPPEPPKVDSWYISKENPSWPIAWAKVGYAKDIVIRLPARVAGWVPSTPHVTGDQAVDYSWWVGPLLLRKRVRSYVDGDYRYHQRWDPRRGWVTMWRRLGRLGPWEYLGPESDDVVVIDGGGKIGGPWSGRESGGLIRRIPYLLEDPDYTYIVVEGCESNRHLIGAPGLGAITDYDDNVLPAWTDLPAIPSSGGVQIRWSNGGINETSAQILNTTYGPPQTVGPGTLGVLRLDYDFAPITGDPPGTAFTQYDRGESGLIHAGVRATADPEWLTTQTYTVWEHAPITYLEADAAIASMGDLVGLPVLMPDMQTSIPWIDLPYVVEATRPWPREKVPYDITVSRPRVVGYTII